MIKLSIATNKRNEMIDITNKIQKIVENEKIKKGLLIIYIPHTTAGITINEGADPSVQYDILNTLNNLIPFNNNYQHLEGNSDAHIKASLLGSSVLVLIENHSIILGTWQKIYLYEGDGPRKRSAYIKIICDQ
jgi:secondary thiamine-phosphate synthase enzyme